MITSFNHISVLLNEAVDALQIKTDGVYVDCTFGGGGHSSAILEKLGPKGKLIGFDQDRDAWQNDIKDERFILVKENFKYITRFLKLFGLNKVDGILADLGVSSHQFDTAERGFSIRFDAPLDMRMDNRSGETAADILQTYTEAQLHQIFEKYGEVRNAKTLAQTIVKQRVHHVPKTIFGFKDMIASCIKGNEHKYLAQVFQALRIEVNQEMSVLEAFLEQTGPLLKSGGRLSIITFHSLEDRLAKNYIKNGTLKQIEMDPFGRKSFVNPLKVVKDIVPSEQEIKNNSRAHSARLRIGEKL